MKIVELEAFQVAGIAARTSNAREMTADGVIPKQWAVAAERLPPGVEKIALYTDYESDVNGEYTFVIGTRGGRVSGVMLVKTVPAGKYAVFTSERGPVSKVVIDTWKRIWAEIPAERSCLADFEVYDERAAHPENAVVDIYVGVK